MHGREPKASDATAFEERPSRGEAPPPLGRTSARLGLLSLAALASGLARESAIAYRYGASRQYDMFLLAAIPFEILSAVAGALVPAVVRLVVAQQQERGAGVADAVWSAVTRRVTLVSWSAGALSLVVGLALVNSEQLRGADAAAPVTLLALMAPAPALATWVAMQGAALNARHRFAGPALTGILLNLIVAGAALLLGGIVGPNALAMGTLLGLSAGLGLQKGLQARSGFRSAGRVPITGETRRFLRESWPLAALALTNRVYVLAERALAVGLSAGTVSVLAFANRFATIPVAVLSAVATPLYTVLVGHAANGDQTAVAQAGGRGLRFTFFVVTPIIVFVAAYAEPVVSAFLGRGSFGAADVNATASVLRVFAVGMFGWVGADLTARILWARGAYFRSFLLASGFVAAYLVAATLLRRVGDSGVGLAAARTLAFTLYCALGLVACRRDSPRFPVAEVMRALGLQVAAAVTAAVLTRWLFEELGGRQLGGLQLIAALGAAGTLFAAAYLACLTRVRRSEEGCYAASLLWEAAKRVTAVRR